MHSLKDFWYIIAESRDLKKDAVIGCSVLGEWLALYRNQEGKAVAVLDRCLHRNARLSKGRVRDGQLVCPYHGWKYGTQGQLTGIPSDGPAFKPRASACLPSFPVREQQGYIYVRLNAKLAKDVPETEPYSIPFFGLPDYQHIRLKHVFEAKVPNCAENFIDIPHTTYVHPTIFRYESAPQKMSAEVEVDRGSVHVRYLDETSNFGLFSAFLNRSGRKIFHEDHYHLPNITHVEYKFKKRRHFNITSQSVPVSDTETHVYTDLTYDYGAWNLLARPLVWWVAKKIIAQDVKIMREQSEVTTKYGEQFASTKADLQHTWIEKIYAELLAGRDPRAIETKKDIVEFWI